jgi:spore coat protein CotH
VQTATLNTLSCGGFDRWLGCYSVTEGWRLCSFVTPRQQPKSPATNRILCRCLHSVISRFPIANYVAEIKGSFYRKAFWARLLLPALAFFAHSSLAAAGSSKTDEFYNLQEVQTIQIEIKSDDLARLQQALPKRISVPGTFHWKEQTFERVGVRYKGDSSSAPHAQMKRSFLISFSEYKTGQRFIGLRHVALDNGIQFGSVFSEPLITETLRNLGVKASRCNYARVYLNGRYEGVYVNVERIDRSFLEQNFGDDGGELFKVDQGGPGSDLRYLPEPAVYEKTFELHAGPKKQGYANLIDFILAINEPKITTAELSRRFGLESFLTTTAVLLFSGAFDQYTGWGPHNYYLYRNPADNRWTYIPWDLDVGFADNAFGRVPVLDGWNAAWPTPVPGRPLMERLVADPELLKRYREKASGILEKHFRPEVLIPKLRANYQLINADLEKDPYPPRRVTVASDRSYEDIIASMEAFIRKRYLLARTQLDNPGNRPTSTEPSGEGEGPRPGPPSADAPTELRAVKVTSSSVELHWSDHAKGEAGLIVQRCLGAEATDFVNAIGQPGQDITSAIDREVQPGQTYRYRVYAVKPTPQGPRGTGVSNTITVHVPEK